MPSAPVIGPLFEGAGEIGYGAGPVTLTEKHLVGIVPNVVVRKYLEECNCFCLYAMDGLWSAPVALARILAHYWHVSSSNVSQSWEFHASSKVFINFKFSSTLITIAS